MDIKEAKSYIQAGFAFDKWTGEQKEAFKVAWECMTKCQQKDMKPEGLMTVLRQYHQLNVYTVGELWCIQLFDLDTDTNDIGVICIYEDDNKSLETLLLDAMAWVERNQELY